MARPNRITLTSKEQSSVLRSFKEGKTGARTIADSMGVSRYQVMAFLESKKLAKYSDGSYE